MRPIAAAESEVPLERESELAAVVQLLDTAAAGRGSLLMFEGEAGIGKTRLVGTALELARVRSFEVLRAVGGEMERELPFGVALQLYEPRVRRAAGPERDELLAGAAALAAPLLQDTPRARGARSEALSLFHGLFWVTCNLAQRSPMLIAVDDAQWADRSSLESLLYLAQRLDELPVALLVAGRPGEAGAAGEVLARLAAHAVARVLRPAPLSAPAVGALVRERFPDCADEFVQACRQATTGNPFLVHELLAALSADGVEPSAAAAPYVSAYAPERIKRSVLVRLARLPPGAAALARAVVILGDDAALRHAAALADLDVDLATDLLEALSGAGILTPAEPIAFGHPLLRASLEADIALPERERLHARAARLLAGEDAAVERVAAHLLHTRPLADRWVIDRLRDAARAAGTRGAPSSAVSYLRRALAEPPPTAVRIEVLVDLADAETAVGVPEAPRRLEEAATLAQGNQNRARILLRLGRALYLQGELAEAAGTFDRGLAELPDEEVAAELQAEWVAVSRLIPPWRRAARIRVAAFVEHPPPGITHGQRLLLARVAELLISADERSDRTRELALRALGDNALLAAETADGTTWMIATAVLVGSEDY